MWKTGTIDELCEIEYGTRVVRKNEKGTIYPVYGGGGETFRVDRMNRSNRVIVSRFGMSEKCTRFVEGDFFLNDSGLTTSPKVDDLSQSYLDRVIFSLNNQIYALGRGAAQKNLDMGAFKSLEISYPPLAEQQRIVAKLDAAFAEIDRAVDLEREKARGARCLFQNAVREKSLAMMQRHGSKLLAELCDLQNGFAFKSSKFREDGTPVLRISNIQNGCVTTDKLVYASQNDYTEDLKKYLVPPGALLIAMSGATTGKVGVNKSEQSFFLNQRVGMLAPKAALERDFLYFFLTTKVEELLSISAGAAQPNLSAKQIKEIQLPNATLVEQKDFSSALMQLDTAIASLLSVSDNKLRNFSALKSAILTEALQPPQREAA